jgi:CheY-like chemotaxis protein
MAYSNLFRKHQRILVVDDEAAIMDTLSYALTIEGYDVVTAGNGPAALAAMHGKKPDLVICDYMMPEMTGAQLAMEMRATRQCADIPVILCTGAHIAQAESQAGLFDVILTKPYPVPTLLHHIDQLMPLPSSSNGPAVAAEKTTSVDKDKALEPKV